MGKSGWNGHFRILPVFVIFIYMTLKDKYIEQVKVCLSKKLRYESGHYQTKIDFHGEPFYVSPDGEDIVRYKFDISGCVKTRIITVNDTRKVLHYHKDRLPVYGKICNKDNVRGLLYKYLLFLRCDGIEDKDLLKLYVLHCLIHKFEFWRKEKTITHGEGEQISIKYGNWVLYDPDIMDVEKLIDGLITSALKKEIDDQTREQFIFRTRDVVNPETEGFRRKTKNEKLRDAKRGLRKATDNKIKTLYDPGLKDEENANRIGISVRRLQEWKRENAEPLEDRIKRLYDPSLSQNKNAMIIGCSPNSIKKYVARTEVVPVEEEDTEENWIKGILEQHSSFWKDVPAAPVKNSDELDDIDEWLKDLE